MRARYIILFALIFLVLVSLVTSVIGLKKPLLILNENQILYLYSTSAQVLAGIYGLTLTGFIFFRNELSREEFEDETLMVAIDNLKKRYFKILLFITGLSIFTLILCNLTISSEDGDNSTLTIILMNIGQSSFVTSLLVITYFIFDVISPRRIEKESKNIQKEVDPLSESDGNGSLEDFLSNYNKIEYILQKYGSAYQSELEGYSHRQPRRISNVRLAEFILRAEKINYEFFNKIKDLITLRNSIIHGAEPIVSKNVVKVSEDILRELAETLKINI